MSEVCAEDSGESPQSFTMTDAISVNRLPSEIHPETSVQAEAVGLAQDVATQVTLGPSLARKSR